MSKAKVTKVSVSKKTNASKSAVKNKADAAENTNKLAAYYDVIRRPVLTEKSSALVGKYVFIVHPDSNKNLVTRAIEAIFGVDVTKINMLNVKGKTKNFKRTVGKRSDYKKALVTLKAGQSIDIGLEV